MDFMELKLCAWNWQNDLRAFMQSAYRKYQHMSLPADGGHSPASLCSAALLPTLKLRQAKQDDKFCLQALVGILDINKMARLRGF